jgi:hypothetical protein
MVYLFSHQLVTLDRCHRLRLEKGKTNRQYLRELANSGDLLAIVRDATRAFEDVFFGRHSLTRERFEQIWGRLDRFHSLAPLPLPAEAPGGAA